jgi:Xaa-Pro aminopeptidase
MKQLDFSPDEYQDRLRGARVALRDHAVDGLIVHDPTNISWLTGWRGKGYQIYQALILTADERPLTLLTRTSDVFEAQMTSIVDDVRGWRTEAGDGPITTLATLLHASGLVGKRVAYELPDYYLSVSLYLKLMALLADTLHSNLTGVIDRLRYRRSPAEIALIRRAAAIADAGAEAGTRALTPGGSELVMAGAMHQAMMAGGGQSPASPMNLVSGDRAAFAHGFPTERAIQRGEIVQAEWGANYHGYHCTMGRMWSLGDPPVRVREYYQVVRAACDAVVDGIRPGVPMADLDRAAKKALGPRLERYATHKTGYLIKAGFPPAWGDAPALAENCSAVLEPGMLVSVEPPLFIPEEGIGVRIIDNVLVTARGGELLSRAPREIIVVG